MFGAILAFSSVAAIGNLAELNDRLVRRFESEQAFSVTATVVSVSEETSVGGSDRERQRLFHVCDGTTLARLSHALADTRVPQPGDRVRLDGRLMRERWGWNNARVESFLKVGRAELPAPMTIDAEGLKDPANRLRFVRMEGVLVDVVERRHVAVADGFAPVPEPPFRPHLAGRQFLHRLGAQRRPPSQRPREQKRQNTRFHHNLHLFTCHHFILRKYIINRLRCNAARELRTLR
mgnify:CR=1 FL=1